MHFKPAWEAADAAKQESKLVAELKSKVAIAEAYKSPALCFPHSFMTYDCAKWAVEVVLAFSKYFSDLLGINDQLDLFRPQLRLPKP